MAGVLCFAGALLILTWMVMCCIIMDKAEKNPGFCCEPWMFRAASCGVAGFGMITLCVVLRVGGFA